MVLPLTRRPLDLFFVVYFLIHIPLTICIDAQVRPTAKLSASTQHSSASCCNATHSVSCPSARLQVLFPSGTYPPFLEKVLSDWIRDFDDALMRTPPLWFRSFVAVEVVTHIPYFILAAYAFAKGREWIRAPTLVYGASVATTLLAILPEAWVRSSAPMQTKVVLMSVYGLWLLLPLMLVARAWGANMFASAGSGAGAAKKKQ